MKSHHSKLDRAISHLKELEGEWGRFLATDPYSYIREDRPANDFLEIVIHARRERNIPPEIGLIVGDAIYCMRSALDHLAHQLAAANTPPQKLKPTSVMFPIHSAVGSYLVDGVWAVSQMSAEAQGRIEKMQPYHGWPGSKEHPLGVLNKLSNIDKHRHMAFTNSISGETTAIVDETATHDAIVVARGTKIAIGSFDDKTDAIQLLAQVTGPDPYVKVETCIHIDPAFPQSGPAAGEVVITELGRICLHIRSEVFPNLDDLL